MRNCVTHGISLPSDEIMLVMDGITITIMTATTITAMISTKISDHSFGWSSLPIFGMRTLL